MDIQPIFRCSVGIDVHLSLICVCVIVAEPGSEPAVHRREFGGFQRDRRAMAEWVAGFKPDIAVMESTGIYWKSPYAALEKAGIRATVVNAQHVKKVPGRKTDTGDAEWLAMLARAGWGQRTRAQNAPRVNPFELMMFFMGDAGGLGLIAGWMKGSWRRPWMG